MSKQLEIGKIVNSHGIKGDIRVIPTTFDIKRFELLENINVFLRDKELILEIERVWYHKSFVILKLKGIDDRNQAESLKGGQIKIPKDMALPLEEDEYYIGDLYSMDVWTETGEFLGELSDIIDTGANDVYVVKNKATSEEILIPAIKKCILSVSLAENKMTVALMEGLRG